MEIDWNLVNANFIRRQLERCTAVSTLFQFKFMINLYSLHRLNRTNVIKSGDEENFKDIQRSLLKGYFRWKTNSTFILIPPCNWIYTYNRNVRVYSYILVYTRAYVCACVYIYLCLKYAYGNNARISAFNSIDM